MTPLEERIRLSQLVFGKNLADYFHNNSIFQMEKFFLLNRIEIDYFYKVSLITVNNVIVVTLLW